MRLAVVVVDTHRQFSMRSYAIPPAQIAALQLACLDIEPFTTTKFMKILNLSSLVLLVALSSGCATITSGTSQTIAVETERNNLPIAGASCRIVTSKGVWNLMTPATFEISKSSDDAKISCEMAGEPKGEAIAKSGFKSNTVGNVLIGGIIGIGVDAMTGAMWAYPTRWLIKLGVPDQFIIDSSLFSGREKPTVAGDTSKPVESPKVDEVKK